MGQRLTTVFISLGRTKAKQNYNVTFFKVWQAGWMVSKL
jgi:hypothetical protein